MIEAKKITKKFGDHTILSDISFQISKGEIYGLIGYNGVGKTTLLKILCGIYRPDSGSAKIQGQSVYENAEIKSKCFFMTEEATFFSQSSLNDMRKFYQGYYPAWNDRTFRELVDWFGVDPDRKINQFSKGMQRQVSLTLAFSTRAEYLFLDEAFDGLDHTMRRQMRELIRYYAGEKGASILISSHNLRELEELADHIGMLNEGRMTYNDSTRQMREKYQTCQFVLFGEDALMSVPHLELLERKPLGGMQTDEEDSKVYMYTCIMQASREEACMVLSRAGAKQIQVRPVQLEEFFQKERNVQEIDWKKIFD